MAAKDVITNKFKNTIMSTRKIQVLKCKCGATYAACIEPDCYEDTEWLKDLGKCLKDGGTVEMSDTLTFRFEKCKCGSTSAKV